MYFDDALTVRFALVASDSASWHGASIQAWRTSETTAKRSL